METRSRLNRKLGALAAQDLRHSSRIRGRPPGIAVARTVKRVGHREVVVGQQSDSDAVRWWEAYRLAKCCAHRTVVSGPCCLLLFLSSRAIALAARLACLAAKPICEGLGTNPTNRRPSAAGSSPMVLGQPRSSSTPRWPTRLARPRRYPVAQMMASGLVRSPPVDATPFYVEGFGATHPRESNVTRRGRAHNRRVELVDR